MSRGTQVNWDEGSHDLARYDTSTQKSAGDAICTLSDHSGPRDEKDAYFDSEARDEGSKLNDKAQ